MLIREAEGTPARAFARFGASYSRYCSGGSAHVTEHAERGVEKHVELDNLSSTEVESKVAQLLNLKQ